VAVAARHWRFGEMERDIVAEIDMALQRMRLRGHELTDSYANLLRTRDAVTDLPYRIISISEDLIGGMAAMIVETNKNTRNQRILRY
jgi:hypothetical protein